MSEHAQHGWLPREVQTGELLISVLSLTGAAAHWIFSIHHLTPSTAMLMLACAKADSTPVTDRLAGVTCI